MASAQNKSWVDYTSLVLLALVLIGLSTGFFYTGPSSDDVADKVVNKIHVPSAEEIAGHVNIPETDSSKVDQLCEFTDGCDGLWDVSNALRNQVSNHVESELTDSNNRVLYREIKDLVDVEDRTDIDSVSVTQVGDVKINHNPSRGLNDQSEITADYVYKVTFYEGGSNTDKLTKYFKISVLVSDLGDGVSDSDVDVTSTELVNSRYVLA